jgi:hypothetical protein
MSVIVRHFTNLLSAIPFAFSGPNFAIMDVQQVCIWQKNLDEKIRPDGSNQFSLLKESFDPMIFRPVHAKSIPG